MKAQEQKNKAQYGRIIPIHRMTIHLMACASIILVVAFSTLPVMAYTPEDCIRCHREESGESSLQIDVEDFKRSAHGPTLTCLDCHTQIEDESHKNEKGANPVSCSECHEQANNHGLSAKGERRPSCYSCHTKHRILGKGEPASSVYPTALKRTCKTCHAAESGESDYLSWFPSLRIVSHGKQDLSRSYERGNCLGCHQGAGAHGEKEPIVDEDCYKCHNQMMGFMHPKADSAKQPGTFTSAWIYQLFIVGVLWTGFRFYTARGREKRR